MIRLHPRFQSLLLSTLLLGLILSSAALPATVSAQGGTTHLVQPGDNLYRLALEYGVTIEAIMAANDITNQHSIMAGQELVIPGATTAREAPRLTTSAGTYAVQPGDTLLGIALGHGVPLWSIIEANALVSPYLLVPGRQLSIPGQKGEVEPPAEQRVSDGDTYTVQPGDTLGAIAERTGTTTWALARINNISDPSTIYAGQILRLRGEPPKVAPAPHAGYRRVIVDLSQQYLYAYEGDSLVYSFVCSSGAAPYFTRTGDFAVQSKIPNAYGGAWNIWMPHWLGIYWAGGSENGIHALPVLPSGEVLWSGYLGTPVSYGCIVLGTQEAALLYDWVEIGTPVSIRD